MKPTWRLTATIDRLIGNIPVACKLLREQGRVSLAGQLERDRNNLVYWQERGGLMLHRPGERTDEELNLCPECGKSWPVTETIRADGSLGCPCQEAPDN